ncbi:hypothetical protein ATCC90586_000838 [Pythium insidiosum]|nr:hypothetical protein ATCC90586_000838 [Pythium insidiosum]
MPGLHLVGEIVGASGLRPRDAGSLAHWLDVLSLHPSRRQSFFCRWRLTIRSHDAGHCQASKPNDSWTAWQVLQGESQGQTQAHAWSPLMPLQDDPDDDGVMLEALWSHPVDLHLVLTTVEPTAWPYLEFEVVSVDEFHLETLAESSTFVRMGCESATD